MKKIFSMLMIGFFMFAAAPVNTAYADDAEDAGATVLTKMSDWAKTVGKDDAEKERILAERKAARKKKHMEKKAAQMKKKADKQAKEKRKEGEKMGKEMKKKMGM